MPSDENFDAKPRSARAWDGDEDSVPSFSRPASTVPELPGWVLPAALGIATLVGAVHFGRSPSPQERPAASPPVAASLVRLPAAVPHDKVFLISGLEAETPKLSPKADPVWAQAYANGEATPHTVRLWDTHDNDGDHVELLVNGRRVDVLRIENGGSEVQIPILKGASTVLTVKAVYDGGGGVTLGIRQGTNQVKMRVMQVGESESLLIKP